MKLLRRKVLAIKQFVQPRLSPADVEKQYEDTRKERLFPLLRLTSRIYLLVTLLWFVLPRAGMATEVWIFYRSNNLFSAFGYVITVTLLQHCGRLWRFYDMIASFWACHFLVFNALTRSHVEELLGCVISEEIYDQGYQLLVCSAWIAGFFVQAEVNVWYVTFVLHCNVGIWLMLGASFGSGIAVGVYVKLTIVYYILCILLCEQCRCSQHNRRVTWLLQKQLQNQADQERAVAQAEREGALAKVYAAEQASLHSFVVAVFDIFGHLEWCTFSDDDEPKLCFEKMPNAALDELLQKPASGQPLDIILGSKSDLDSWHRERQRLWEYAAIEAASTTPAEHAARKIRLTCSDAHGSAFEIELFVRPGFADRPIFGMLVLRRTSATAFASESHDFENIVRTPRVPTATTRSLSTSSSITGSDVPVPFEASSGHSGEISVWVDASSGGLPVLRCSVGFTLISGPFYQGIQFLDMVVNRKNFLKWFQQRLNDFAAVSECQVSDGADSSNDRLECVCEVRLRPFGAARSILEFRGQCYLDFSAGAEKADVDSNLSERDVVPILVVFKSVVQHLRKKGRPRRSLVAL